MVVFGLGTPPGAAAVDHAGGAGHGGRHRERAGHGVPESELFVSTVSDRAQRHGLRLVHPGRRPGRQRRQLFTGARSPQTRTWASTCLLALLGVCWVEAGVGSKRGSSSWRADRRIKWCSTPRSAFDFYSARFVFDGGMYCHWLHARHPHIKQVCRSACESLLFRKHVPAPRAVSWALDLCMVQLTWLPSHWVWVTRSP